MRKGVTYYRAEKQDRWYQRANRWGCLRAYNQSIAIRQIEGSSRSKARDDGEKQEIVNCEPTSGLDIGYYFQLQWPVAQRAPAVTQSVLGGAEAPGGQGSTSSVCIREERAYKENVTITEGSKQSSRAQKATALANHCPQEEAIGNKRRQQPYRGRE